jgi:ABC-type oligopeptide transport system ATPase subunit
MNAELFKRLLQIEAEHLYHQGSTPESFMNRIRPMIEELLKESRSETMSENNLEEILISSKSKENQNSKNRNCFFDVVDLSMYRAN